MYRHRVLFGMLMELFYTGVGLILQAPMPKIGSEHISSWSFCLERWGEPSAKKNPPSRVPAILFQQAPLLLAPFWAQLTLSSLRASGGSTGGKEGKGEFNPCSPIPHGLGSPLVWELAVAPVHYPIHPISGFFRLGLGPSRADMGD